MASWTASARGALPIGRSGRRNGRKGSNKGMKFTGSRSSSWSGNRGYRASAARASCTRHRANDHRRCAEHARGGGRAGAKHRNVVGRPHRAGWRCATSDGPRFAAVCCGHGGGSRSIVCRCVGGGYRFAPPTLRSYEATPPLERAPARRSLPAPLAATSAGCRNVCRARCRRRWRSPTSRGSAVLRRRP
jgi:hypothetical protein